MAILRDGVIEAEGQLDAVGDSVGAVVGEEHVAIVAAPPVPIECFISDTSGSRWRRFTQRLSTSECEDAVAAVGDRVLDDDVVAALLEHEQAGRVLPAVVHAVAVAAHTEIEGISRDDVPATAPHGETPSGKERAIVVVHSRIINGMLNILVAQVVLNRPFKLN